jgi:hypothetical protein
MGKMIDWLFGKPPKTNEWKYIGRMRNAISYGRTDMATGKRENTVVFIDMYMTDDGKRKAVWPTSPKNIENEIQAFPNGQEVNSWLNGGPFPKKFEPETDTLGPMLRRIVDIQMGLEKGGDDEA